MKNYINSILPKIRRFSESLDKNALLIEQPWVNIDSEGNYEKLIFRKNNELIMSSNGIASTGKWEYLPSANSLLIDRVKDKILLNQEFVEKGLMILKFDGFSDKYFILANENIIPDLNIERYLRNIYYKNCNVKIIYTTNNQEYEILRNDEYETTGLLGQTVLRNAVQISDCSFQSDSSKVIYYVKDSKIYKKSIIKEIKASDGTILLIECYTSDKPKKGDIVRLSHNKNDFAHDGIYKIGMFSKIKVENGVIV